MDVSLFWDLDLPTPFEARAQERVRHHPHEPAALRNRTSIQPWFAWRKMHCSLLASAVVGVGEENVTGAELAVVIAGTLFDRHRLLRLQAYVDRDEPLRRASLEV